MEVSVTSIFQRLTVVPWLIITTLIYFCIVRPLYNVFLHPLSKYPGPKMFAASRLPWGYWYRSGLWHNRVLELHQQYGNIVRVAPDELSYAIPEAWDDIYGRANSSIENLRPEWFVSSTQHMIIGANQADQKRMKTVLAPGFSRSALARQEPILKKHLDTFVQQLRKECNNGARPINLLRWINYTTFDIIGELLFGHDFGCIAGDQKMRSWQDVLMSNLQLLHVLAVCKRIWIFWLLLPWHQLWKVLTQYRLFDRSIAEQVKQRLVNGNASSEHEDFLEMMMNGKNENYMTRKEIFSNVNLLTMAGSESSANSTASLVFRIAMNPSIKDRLLKELQGRFQTVEEINSQATSSLPYLMGVVEEGLRLHPVTPNALWRITPRQGNRILGDELPGNTVLSIHHRVMYRSEQNFKRPLEFIPERWMPTTDMYAEFTGDRRDAFHPFSCGPRMCPAKNLGYAEMTLIISRLLWSFDIEVTEQSLGWAQGLQAWTLWDKKPLWLRLIPRE